MAGSEHIRNPVEWGVDGARRTATAIRSGGRAAAGKDAAREVIVNRITTDDLKDSLRKGMEDFAACRTDVIFVALIYPLAGLLLARATFGYGMLPLLFPLAAGFALLGPVAALGLYEMSRRREQGREVGWSDALKVFGSPAIGAIATLGLALVGIFLIWLVAAWLVYEATLGPEPPASMGAFANDVFTTAAGWAMIVVGTGVGFLFAALVLTISVVSFPMLLDRDVGVATAVRTSVRVVRLNPVTMAAWGAIVAGGLALGSLPLLLGLVFVVPALGHATWHLYRKAVAAPRP